MTPDEKSALAARFDAIIERGNAELVPTLKEVAQRAFDEYWGNKLALDAQRAQLELMDRQILTIGEQQP